MDVRESYDRVAAEYARRIAGELAGKPLDRALLDCLAEQARGTICDLGCGPGHVAGYLKSRGARVCGIDLSPGQLEEARRLHPEIEFTVGDMQALDVPDAAFGGIAAMYSVIHVPRPEIPRAFREMRRVLSSTGLLLVSFHVGTQDVHRDDLWGIPVKLDFQFFCTREMTAWIREAGFGIESVTTRAPYPGVEHPSERCYILARKP